MMGELKVISGARKRPKILEFECDIAIKGQIAKMGILCASIRRRGVRSDEFSTTYKELVPHLKQFCRLRHWFSLCRSLAAEFERSAGRTLLLFAI